MTEHREPITDQQIKWWKGVFLPPLAKDTGDTIDWWENKLKISVMPDKFAAKTMTLEDAKHG